MQVHRRARRQGLGAALVRLLRLLVGDHREPDPDVLGFAEVGDREQHRRQRSLHVVGAAPHQPVALDPRRELAGLAGDDPAGDTLCGLLRAAGVDVGPVLRDRGRPTTTKTRVIAHSQQVVRIDHESPGPTPEAVEAALLARIGDVLPTVRGCVVSDYGKGVVTPRFAGQLLRLARSAGVPVVIDPKGLDYQKYRGATLVKPNQLEAGQVLNRHLRSDEDVDRAGADLLDLLGPDTAVGKFLARSGPGLHHVAYGTDDIDSALAAVRDAGLALIDEQPRTGIRGSRVAFLHPKSTGGVLTELVEAQEGH